MTLQKEEKTAVCINGMVAARTTSRDLNSFGTALAKFCVNVFFMFSCEG